MHLENTFHFPFGGESARCTKGTLVDWVKKFKLREFPDKIYLLLQLLK